MKIVFLTEGGKGKGFGHISRCISLWQVLQDKGYSADFIVNGEKSISEFFHEVPIQNINWVVEKDKLIEVINDAAIVIIDSYNADKETYKMISNIARTCVYIDDTNRLDYPKGVLINGLICAKDLGYFRKKDTLYLLGPKYAPLRKSFNGLKKRSVRKEINKVFIAFSQKNLERINMLKSNINKMISGVSINGLDEYNNASEKDILETMMESDICISGGGQTVYETAVCGVPTIGICFAKNQLINLKKWDEIGFLKFIGWYNDNNLIKNLEMALIEMNYENRMCMSEIGKDFIDGKGSLRIITEVLSYAKI